MEAKRVGELMIQLDEYPHVGLEATLSEAIKVLENSSIEIAGRKSLPRMLLVFDKNSVLMGTLRRRDIMRGLEPEFLGHQPLYYKKKLFDVAVDPNIYELTFDKMVKGIKQRAERKVVEVMRPIKLTIDYDDHLFKAIYEIVDNNLSLLPVCIGNKVVGVIRSVDVFRELAQILES
jgi:predicted transcriptional regulator